MPASALAGATLLMFADKVLILHNGESVACGNTADVMTKPLLEEVFNKEIFILDHPKTNKPIIVG